MASNNKKIENSFEETKKMSENQSPDDKILFHHIKNMQYLADYREILKELEIFYKEFPEFEKIISSETHDPAVVKVLLDKIEVKYPGFKELFNTLMKESLKEFQKKSLNNKKVEEKKRKST